MTTTQAITLIILSPLVVSIWIISIGLSIFLVKRFLK